MNKDDESVRKHLRWGVVEDEQCLVGLKKNIYTQVLDNHAWGKKYCYENTKKKIIFGWTFRAMLK